VHACVPAWFTRTGSRSVRALARELDERSGYPVAAADSASDWASLHSRSRS
jgi:hypothetical protein